MIGFAPTDLLPHRGAMVLVDTLESADASTAVCAVTIREDHPFAVGGLVPAVIGIEWIAQTVGAHVGYAARIADEPIRIGYLLGAREMDVLRDHVRVGDAVRIEVRRLFGDRGLATYSGTVTLDGDVIVRGSVNVYQEDT